MEATNTTPSPTPEELSDEALKEIEATITSNAPLRTYLQQFGIEIPALCASLRAARAERDEAIKARDLFVSLKRGQTERADELHARGLELLEENAALREQLADAENELRRRRNGDELPEGWAMIDVGDGFPNLYLYSRADIIGQAKARLAEVEKERDEARRALQRRCSHPNTYSLTATTRRCHDCGAEILL